MSFQTANDEGYSTYYGKGKFDVYKSVRAPILDGINVLLVTFKNNLRTDNFCTIVSTYRVHHKHRIYAFIILDREIDKISTLYQDSNDIIENTFS